MLWFVSISRRCINHIQREKQHQRSWQNTHQSHQQCRIVGLRKPHQQRQTATGSNTKNSTVTLRRTIVFYLLCSRKLFVSKASGTWHTTWWESYTEHLYNRGKNHTTESYCSLSDFRLVQTPEHCDGSIKVWAPIFRESDLMFPLYDCVDSKKMTLLPRNRRFLEWALTLLQNPSLYTKNSTTQIQ